MSNVAAYDLPRPDDPPAWQELAACNGEDPDLFFPGQGQDTGPAKAICEECDVRQECLQYALQNKEKYGVWGGLSERQRRRLRTNPDRFGPIKNHGTGAGAQAHYRRGEALCEDCRKAWNRERGDRRVAVVSHNRSVLRSVMDERAIEETV